MRGAADRRRIERLLVALGQRVREPHTVYLVGGASAVLEGWRESTLDVDLRPEPDSDAVLRALSELKEELDINVEPASPLDFLPGLSGWREHSPHLTRHGTIDFRHMDFRLQALAKLERASGQDLQDARTIVRRGLVTLDELHDALVEMQAGLYRFPAVDPETFTGRTRRFIEEMRRSARPPV